MKGAVPGEIVDAGRGFEKDNWLPLRIWKLTRNTPRHPPDLEVIEMTGQSSLDILGVEIFNHNI